MAIISISINLGISNAFSQLNQLIASTRGSFDLTSGKSIHQPNIPSALSLLTNNSNCPGELAIYVHGVWATPKEAREQAQRVYLSLAHEGYHIPVIGFSWDSNTAFSLDNIAISQAGWATAKKIANGNGPLLGKFIIDFKQKCPNDKLRIIAHSLGSRVVLSAVQWLYDNDEMKNNYTDTNKIISSIHLIGGAINNDQLSLNQDNCRFNTPSLPCSGNAIESKVQYFYNLYDPEDNMLASEKESVCLYWACEMLDLFSPYQYTESHNALGAYGVINSKNIPSNYIEHNVLPQIINDADANKDKKCDITIDVYFVNYCTITKVGDNHNGYMGYRSSINPSIISNSGAIKTVVSDWKSEK